MATGQEARIVLTAKDETAGAFSSAQRGMQQVGAAADGLVSRVGGLGAAFGVLGGAIAGAISVQSLRGAVDTLDQLDDLSEKSGIAAESLSALRYAGEVVGTPMEALGTGVKKLAQNMALAAGGAKEQGAVFEALGVKLKNMDGSLRGSDKVLADIATKFKSFKDGPEKAALAMQVFGKSGTDMIPVLNQGADGIQRLADEAKKLGVVYSGDLAKSAADFNDNLKKLGFAAEAFKVQVANELLPTLNNLSAAMIESNDSAGTMAEMLGTTVAVGLQAFAILVANTAFVLKGVGREIGAIAAQTVALATLDIDGFNAISEAVKEDGVRARAELDALELRILGVGRKLGEGNNPSAFVPPGGGVGGAAAGEAARAAAAGAGAAAAAAAAKAAGEAAKKAAEEFTNLYNKISGKDTGVDADFGKNLATLKKGLDAGRIGVQDYVRAVEQYIAQQPFAVAAEKAAIKVAEERQALRIKEAAGIEEFMRAQTAAYSESLASVTEQITRLQDEEEAARIAAQSNIALATAVEQVAIARLQEKQARFIEGSEGWEAVEREIAARRELMGLINSSEIRKANTDAAKDAAKDWESASKQISDSLVDNLMRGGKSVAQYLKDLFRTLVLRPLLQPVGNAFSGMIGGGGVGAGASASSAGGGLGNFSGLLGLGGGVGAAGATFGSGLTAGFAALTGEAGIMGALSAGATSIGAGSVMAGLGTIAGALGPIALGVMAIASLVGKRGETRVGGVYQDGNFVSGPSGGEIGGDQVRQTVKATMTSINDTLRALGSSASLQGFVSGLEQSEKGKGFAFAGGRLSTGAAFGQGTDGQGFTNRRGSMTSEQASAAFGEELKQATLQALQAADVPGLLGDYLRELGDIDALSGGALDAALGRINTALTQKQALEAQLLTATSSDLENLVRARNAEREAIDASQRGLWDQVRVATEQRSLEARLFDLTATDTQKLARARELERAAIDPVNLALLEQVHALEDLRNAANGASAATAATAESMGRITSKVDSIIEQFISPEAYRQHLAGKFQSGLADIGIDLTIEQVLSATKEQFAQGFRDLMALGDLPKAEAFLDLADIFLQLQPPVADLAGALEEVEAPATDAADALRALMDATDGAYSALERAVGKQRESAQLTLDVAQEQVNALEGLFGLLKGQVRELYQQVDSTAAFNAAAGRRFIGDALATAQTTGYLPEQGALADAIGAVRQGMDGTAYKTRIDADRDRLVLANQLAKLRDVTGEQLSTAERQVMMAQDQIKALDDILDNAREQIDALRGIDTSVLSVAAAIGTLSAAIAAERAGPAAVAAAAEVAPSAYAPQATPATAAAGGYTDAQIAAAARESLAQGFSVADTYAGALSQYGISHADLERAARAAGVPGFASGGFHAGGWALVGERGPELAFMPPAQIYSAPQTRAMQAGAMAGADVLAELRAIKAELALVRSAAATSASADKDTAEVLTRVTRGGVSIYTTAA